MPKTDAVTVSMARRVLAELGITTIYHFEESGFTQPEWASSGPPIAAIAEIVGGPRDGERVGFVQPPPDDDMATIALAFYVGAARSAGTYQEDVGTLATFEHQGTRLRFRVVFGVGKRPALTPMRLEARAKHDNRKRKRGK